MSTLKETFKKNVNIMEYFRKKNGVSVNNLDAILYSYDMQAGGYRNNYYNGFMKRAHLNGQKISLSVKDYYKRYGKEIANIFNGLRYSSILEAGVGEATTLLNVIQNLSIQNIDIKGIDISFSRIGYGNIFLQEHNINNVSLGVGNIFEIPFKDNAFDIVYTYHCIEPNTARAKEAVEELYRVSNKYLILIEPDCVLGNEETKKHIIKNAYCQNLVKVIKEMDYKLVEHKLFKIGTYNNQDSLIIIEKESNKKLDCEWSCPLCKNDLLFADGNYFCQECNLIFPIIKEIPCLLRENSILGSKYLDF